MIKLIKDKGVFMTELTFAIMHELHSSVYTMNISIIGHVKLRHMKSFYNISNNSATTQLRPVVHRMEKQKEACYEFTRKV